MKRHDNLFKRVQERCLTEPHHFVDYCLSTHRFILSDGQELLAIAERIASSLRHQVEGPLVFLWLDRCTTFIPAAWGCLAAGLTVLPLPIAASTGRPKENERAELLHLLQQYAPAPIIVDEISAHAQQWLPPDLDVHWLHLSSLVTAKPISFMGVQSAQIAYVLQTSGTTGISKYAAFSGEWFPHEQDRDQSALVLFPLASSSGFPLVHALNPLSVYLPLRFAMQQPNLFLQAIQDYRIAEVGLPPVMAKRLLKYFIELPADMPRLDLSCLRRFVVGSSTILLEIVNELQAFLQAWGAPNDLIHFSYGLTETGGAAYGPFKHCLHHQHPQGLLIGSIRPGVDIRIAGDDPSNVGPVEICRPFPFLGYLKGNGSALDLKPFSSGYEWFQTGDLGFLDGNFFVLSGREKDTIEINSRKISLSLVEVFVQDLWQKIWPGQLHEVIACAGPHNHLVLFLVVEESNFVFRIASVLKKVINRNLQRHFGLLAADIMFRSIESVPRSYTGKVQKYLLLNSLSQDPHRQPSLSGVNFEQRAMLLSLLFLEIRSCASGAISLSEDAHLKISDLGLDSLEIAQMIGNVERRSGLRCRLEQCSYDPSLEELAGLFVAHKDSSIMHHRIGLTEPPLDLDRYPQREALAQMIRAANLQQGSGAWIEAASMLRGFNLGGKGTPVIFLGNLNGKFVKVIADKFPQNPFYFARTLQSYAGEENNAYLACCYVDWFETILHQSSPILVGFCLSGLLAMAVAKQLWCRKNPASLTVLMDWNVGFRRTVSSPYEGACVYHIHSRALQNRSTQKQLIEEKLLRDTPNIPFVYWSSAVLDSPGQTVDVRETARCLIAILRRLSQLDFLKTS